MHHDLQYGSRVTQKGLCTIDNEIWLERIHFVFSLQGIFLRIELLLTNWRFRARFSFIFTKILMHTNDDAQMRKAVLQIEGQVASGKVNANTMTLQLALPTDSLLTYPPRNLRRCLARQPRTPP
jgi:hypothetical protein